MIGLHPKSGAVKTGLFEQVDALSDTTVTYTWTVPAGSRWWLFGGHMWNGDDVARDMSMLAYDSDDTPLGVTLIARIATPSNAIRRAFDPALTGGLKKTPVCLGPGMKVVATFFTGGPSTGGFCTVALHVVQEPAS